MGILTFLVRWGYVVFAMFLSLIFGWAEVQAVSNGTDAVQAAVANTNGPVESELAEARENLVEGYESSGISRRVAEELADDAIVAMMDEQGISTSSWSHWWDHVRANGNEIGLESIPLLPGFVRDLLYLAWFHAGLLLFILLFSTALFVARGPSFWVPRGYVPAP